jgi:hypothetical protein
MPFWDRQFKLVFRYGGKPWDDRWTAVDDNLFRGTLPYTSQTLKREDAWFSSDPKWKNKAEGYDLYSDQGLHWGHLLTTYFQC